MVILEVIGVIYLIIGTVYGLYIWLFQGDVWHQLPINIILGPVFLVYNFLIVRKRYKNRKI